MAFINTLCCVLFITLLSGACTAHPAARADHQNFRNILLSTRTVDSKRSLAIHEDAQHQKRVQEALPSERHQYLVHLVATATDADVKRVEAELKTTFKAYFPHHTYLMFAPDQVAHQARGVDGVEWVGSFHPEYKHRSDNGRALGPIVELQASLVPNTFSAPETDAIANRWVAALDATKTKLSAASAGLISVLVPAAKLSEVINFVTHQPEVHWVEESSEYEVHNVYLKYIVQSNVKDSFPLHSANLTGAGQIVGVGDTGLDFYNCFFRDPIAAVGIPLNKLDSADSNHRKLQSYITSNGDAADRTGHGTHVAGTIAGQVLTAPFDATLDANLNPYNGLAFGSKLTIMDLNRAANGVNIVPPAGLDANYFSVFQGTGAKVVCSAWGTSSSSRSYATTEKETDSFMYANKDFVAVFSAGNLGQFGPGSVTSPATAKNVIAVGETGSSGDAYASEIDIASFERIANTTYRELCIFKNSSYLSDADFCATVGAPENSTNCYEQAATQYCANDSLPLNPTTCCSFNFFADKCCASAAEVIRNDPLYSQNNLIATSSVGPTYDGRIKPDVVAPGEPVWSMNARSNSNGTHCNPFNGPNDPSSAVTVNGGSSSSAAAVTAMAVLTREYYIKGFYPSGKPSTADGFTPSSALVKATIIHAGQPITGVSGVGITSKATYGTLTSFPSNQQGFGRVQMNRALYFNTDTLISNKQFVVEKAGSASTNDDVIRCVAATADPSGLGNDLKVTLVWTDPAASPAAGLALVNNLDLVVVDAASGEVFYPNNLGQADAVNNVEQVIVPVPSAGRSFLVHVFGTLVPQGPQEYALVISGNIADCESSSRACARACSGNGKCDTATGKCACVSPYFGVDCAMTRCATNCSGNGACNAAGNCVCGSGYTGDNCQTPLGNGGGTIPPVIVNSKKGIATGAFIGTVIGVFIFGALLAFFGGVFAGLKYAEHRRKQAKKKADKMLADGDHL